MGTTGMGKPIRIIARPHALRPELLHAEVEAGDTVAEILGPCAQSIHVWLNDAPLPREFWKHVRPKPGTELLARAIATHGGQRIVQVLGIASTVLFGGGVGLLVTGVGLLLVNTFTRQPPFANVQINSFDRLRAITGTRNQINLFGAISRIYGRHRLFPCYASKPFTELVGQDQYFRVLLCLGYGPLNVYNIKIGDTLVTPKDAVVAQNVIATGLNFENLTYEVSSAPTLFSDSIIENSLTLPMNARGDQQLRTTAVNTKEISLDFTFPTGLYATDIYTRQQGWLAACRVVLTIEYAPTGTGAWVSATGATGLQFSGSNAYVNNGYFKFEGRSADAARLSLRFTVPQGQYDVRITRVATEGKIYDGTVDCGASSAPPTDEKYRLWNNTPGDPETRDVHVDPNTGYFTDPTTGYNGWHLGGCNDQQVFAQMTLSTIRSITPLTLPINSGLVYLCMRLKATDQFNGIVDSINCEGESILNVWNGAAFVQQATSNPAWIYLDVLSGSATERAVDRNTRFKLADLLAWANANDANGLAYSATIDARNTTFELARDVAAVGRASFGTLDGQYTVVRDIAGQAPTQVFTPRNSWGFTSTRAYADLPHALRVRFINPDLGYLQDERIVYDDGYDATNATRFELLELRGVTSADQAWKEGRYQLAAKRLRQEIYSLNVDVENLVAKRGDLVQVQHDVISVGQISGRIKAIAGNVLTFDEQVTQDGASTYAVRIRKNDGSIALQTVNIAAGTSNMATLSGAVAGVNPGDLFMFGLSGSESIACKVIRIEPGPDFSARLLMVDDAPGVYIADAGIVPAYIVRTSVDRTVPDPPIIDFVQTDESVLLSASDGSLQSRILVTLHYQITRNAYPAVIEGQFRTAGVDPWKSVPNASSISRAISFMPVADGQAYDVRVRVVTSAGVVSDWAYANNIKVIGKTSVPPDVTIAYVSARALQWQYDSPPLDLAGFRIRYNLGQNTNWNSATAAHSGLIGGPPFNLSSVPTGNMTLLIKAVDTSGNESTNAFAVGVNLGALRPDNTIYSTTDYNTSYPGVITNGTVAGTNLNANDAAGLFWNNNGDAAFWSNPNASLFWTGTYLTLTYQCTFTPPSDVADPNGTLTLAPLFQGTDVALTYRSYGLLAFWGTSDPEVFWGADANTFWAESVEAYRPWPGVLNGVHRQQYDFQMVIQGGMTQGQISSFPFVIDLPTLDEVLHDVSLPVGGIRLPVAKRYRSITGVGLTLVNGAAGITPQIVDRLPIGPLVQAIDGGGNSVAATMDAHIRGI